MLRPSPVKPVSFKDVALSGRSRYLFYFLLVMTVVGLGAGAALLPVRIPDCSGSGLRADIPVEVPDHSAQPVKVYVSHDFRLVLLPDSDKFLVDGVERFDYSLVLTDENGDEAAAEYSDISAPGEHNFGYRQEDTVTVTQEHSFTLRPGKYTLTLASNQPVEVLVDQTSLYSLAGGVLMITGVACAAFLAFVSFLALRKRDALRTSQLRVEMPSVPSPPPAGSNPPVVPAQCAAPLPADPRRSTLEYVPPRDYVEFVCTACGWTIRNPPIHGLITCDRCGETGWLY